MYCTKFYKHQCIAQNDLKFMKIVEYLVELLKVLKSFLNITKNIGIFLKNFKNQKRMSWKNRKALKIVECSKNCTKITQTTNFIAFSMILCFENFNNFYMIFTNFTIFFDNYEKSLNHFNNVFDDFYGFLIVFTILLIISKLWIFQQERHFRGFYHFLVTFTTFLLIFMVFLSISTKKFNNLIFLENVKHIFDHSEDISSNFYDNHRNY